MTVDARPPAPAVEGIALDARWSDSRGMVLVDLT
jgi:hypothetical protein